MLGLLEKYRENFLLFRRSMSFIPKASIFSKTAKYASVPTSLDPSMSAFSFSFLLSSENRYCRNGPNRKTRYNQAATIHAPMCWFNGIWSRYLL